jgi:predicted RNase H-like HicB family nuclease
MALSFPWLATSPLLHFLSVQDEGMWVIHCLDFDIASQGMTEEEAQRNLVNAIELLFEQAVEEKNEAGIFKSAPQDLWEIFVKAPTPKKFGNIRVNIRIPVGGERPPRKIRVEGRVAIPA